MCNAFHVYSYLMCNVSFSENTYLKFSFCSRWGKILSILYCACESCFIVSGVPALHSVSAGLLTALEVLLSPQWGHSALPAACAHDSISALWVSAARLHVSTCSACLSACVMTSSSMLIITSWIISLFLWTNCVVLYKCTTFFIH